MSEIELASIHSFLAVGHDVRVYSYTPIANLPRGVEARDAAEILPAEKILTFRDREHPSPALHSDLFRYAMLKKTTAIWVDLDIIALKPFPDDEFLFGFEEAGLVNGAVLRLPAASGTLHDLLQFKPDTRGVPPQITGFRRYKYWLKTFGRGYSIDCWPWGSIGPKGLTTFLRRNDEMHHAKPVEVFYPVSVKDHAALLEPGRWTEADFGPQTCCVHLWGKHIRDCLCRTHGGKAPQGSFLARAIDAARIAGMMD
ncbi:hypothetical protein [Paracoccus alkanivorans]|uniref:Alpha 1,4-glycosyltransferase domain-containing protein n=1 Tax=Paracoccus alkanivorans TaxID=2116655 RepID=A0A3M0MAI4_9RHOB|nr:hypothetical protein [Paracoccus alkanivorans]RMC34213.1 hypothetical protein C9E81_13650 [Paracoccus alkanivorans]